MSEPNQPSRPFEEISEGMTVEQMKAEMDRRLGNPPKPPPRSVELMLPGGKPSRVWMCLACQHLHNRSYTPIGDGKGRAFTDEERDEFGHQEAERCCQEAKCERCGAGLERKHREGGWTICEACRQKRDIEQEAARLEKATKIPVGWWDGGGMLYDAQADRWFTDLDAAEEWYADDEERERPAYLWCSTAVQWSPDMSGYIGDQISNADYKRLDEFVAKWWEEVKPTSYNLDFSRCVLLEVR